MQTKIWTVRDERMAKIRQEETAIARESKAYIAMIAAGYRFEMRRNQSLAKQSEALGLMETAEGYWADAARYEAMWKQATAK